jgi:hypothetical protein
MKWSPLVTMKVARRQRGRRWGVACARGGREYACSTNTLIVQTPGAGMVGLRGDQVAVGNQFVAFDGGVVAKWSTYRLARFW